jgi:hypothetical protein
MKALGACRPRLHRGRHRPSAGLGLLPSVAAGAADRAPRALCPGWRILLARSVPGHRPRNERTRRSTTAPLARAVRHTLGVPETDHLAVVVAGAEFEEFVFYQVVPTLGPPTRKNGMRTLV